MPRHDTSASSKRRAKLLVVSFAGLGIAWLIFRLFEPVFVWSSGWKPLPAVTARLAPPDESDSSQGPGRTSANAFLDADWSALGETVDARLREARTALGAPAISAAVSVGGKRVWAEATGLADVESRTDATLHSSFRLGSTSKAVTSVAVGTLLDDQRLDLDLPVRHYVPDLAPPLATITTRQAMSHTAGVRDYGLCWCFPVWEHLNRRSFPSLRDALRVFETDPLRFPPGQDFAYSSFGFNVAGAVLEGAAAAPFLDYLERAVFEPLEMVDSGGDFAQRSVSQRVSFYETQEGRYKPAQPVDNSIRWPSGGLLSTPSDMVALGGAMLSDRLLTAATREVLLTPQPLADGRENPQGYALGWRVAADKKLFDGRVTTRILSHHGTAVGSTSYFAALPDFDLVISVMMNKGLESVDSLTPHATALAEIFVAEDQRRRALQPPGR